MVTEDQVLSKLREVVDPEIGVNLVDLGMIRGLQIHDERIDIQVVLTVPGCPLATYLLTEGRRKAETVAGGRTVYVTLLDEAWEPASGRERWERVLATSMRRHRPAERR